MIASPSDTKEARDSVESAIHDWNSANSSNKNVFLLPWRWETSSVPELGDHPQALINAQGVDDSDIVFGLFGSRLGSPTLSAVSGTVEEVERAVEQGKPVHLYFSTAPLPNDVDTAQLEGLRDFKRQIQERGLLGEFASPTQLTVQVWQAIEHDISRMDITPVVTGRPSEGIRFDVQPKQEREVRDYDKKGKPRYTTRHWIEVTNVGDADAQEVRFEPVGERSSMLVMTNEHPTVIHAGQTRTLGVEHVLAGGDPDVLRITWLNDGEEVSKDFHV